MFIDDKSLRQLLGEDFQECTESDSDAKSLWPSTLNSLSPGTNETSEKVADGGSGDGETFVDADGDDDDDQPVVLELTPTKSELSVCNGTDSLKLQLN